MKFIDGCFGSDHLRLRVLIYIIACGRRETPNYVLSFNIHIIIYIIIIIIININI